MDDPPIEQWADDCVAGEPARMVLAAASGEPFVPRLRRLTREQREQLEAALDKLFRGSS